MKKIITAIFITALLIMASFSKIFAEITDYFDILEKLKIGEILSDDLISKGEYYEQGKTLNENPYYFDSYSYSRPHLVKINNENIIVHIGLRIPPDQIKKYQKQIKSLGEPDLTQKKSTSETLISFPEKGIGFIIDERYPDDIEAIKFIPKIASEFIEKEGKRYDSDVVDPISGEIIISKESKNESYKEAEEIKSAEEKNKSSLIRNVFIALIVIGSISLVLLTIKARSEMKKEINSNSPPLT